MELFVEESVLGETRVIGHAAGRASGTGGGLAEVKMKLGKFFGWSLSEVGAALFSPRGRGGEEGRAGRGGG